MRSSSRRVRLGCLSVLLASTFGTLPVSAQDPPSTNGPNRVGCLRGRPLPVCRTFWVVEMQGAVPLVRGTRLHTGPGSQGFASPTFESVLEWNLGHMVNLSPTWAIGGLLTAGSGNSDPLVGVRARARRWLGADFSVELEAGALRSDAAGGRPASVTGGTAAVRLNVRDQGSFFLRWDVLDLEPLTFPGVGIVAEGGVKHGVSVGAGLGSVPALIGTGALGLGYLIALAIFLGTYD